MATKTPSPSPNNPASSPGVVTTLPPEEEFWERYSPHHEFPLSGVSSIVVHGVVIAVLVCWGIIMLKLGLQDKNKPLPLAAVVVAGGGGNPEGVGNRPGEGPPPKPTPRELALEKPTPNPEVTPKPSPDLPTTPEAQVDLARLKEQINDRSLQQPNPSLDGLAQLSDEVKKKLFAGVAAGHGQGGPGSGGGKDKGKDTGEGSLTGPGKEKISERQKRVLRWTMIFDTANGEDYLRQLTGLGAILAVPENGQYLVYDLSQRPVRPKVEDLAQIHRIFWVDNQPTSVRNLAMALRLTFVPAHIVAFFPESVEKELLQKELAFKGLSEDQIHKTVFKVVRVGGRYTPVVTEQD